MCIIRTRFSSNSPTSLQRGFTLVELLTVIVVLGILTSLGAFAMGNFGLANRIRSEADGLVDAFWEMRARAVSGVQSPCVDFPTDHEYRLFEDSNNNGRYDQDEPVKRVTRLSKGIHIVDRAGGVEEAANAVCFRTTGTIGSGSGTLFITFGDAGGSNNRTVRFLAATGKAKVM